MRILICGNCVWKDAKPIFDVMHDYTQTKGIDPVFISGMAPGADFIAYVLCYALDVYCDQYPANKEGERKIKALMGDWYDESSRNQWMLDSGVDVCHAFAKDLPGQWSGTLDMVKRCMGDKVPCFWHDGTKKYEVLSVGENPQDTKVVEVS